MIDNKQASFSSFTNPVAQSEFAGHEVEQVLDENENFLSDPLMFDAHGDLRHFKSLPITSQ